MFKLDPKAPIGTEGKFQGTTYLKTPDGWAQYELSKSEDRRDYEARKREIKTIKDDEEREKERQRKKFILGKVLATYLKNRYCQD